MKSKHEIHLVLEENQRRLQEMYAEYNPQIGIGSPIKRFAFKISQSLTWHLPVEMLTCPIIQAADEFPSFEDYITSIYKENSAPAMLTAMKELMKIRLGYDFEFWCASCVKIWNKITKQEVPFILNRPQRRYLSRLEAKRMAGKPIRLIVTKARQWGGSTETQVYMAWIQLFRKRNWHSVIIADVDDQARHIRGMFSRLARHHPKDIMPVTLVPYEGSQKIRQVMERGNIIGVGSVKQPENLRSYDFSMAHLSEVGLWKSTTVQSAESLAQSIRGTVPFEPYTLIVLESTAKGVGNFFHEEWLNAVSGKSEYDPVFVPWYEIEIYQRPIEDYREFTASMTDYDWFQWDQGATLEGINWYKTFKAAENRDELTMFQEFPTTAEEAFQSTGHRAFNPVYVQVARKNCMDPIFVGDIVGDAVKGKDAFRNLRLEKNPNGNLWIWSIPDKDVKMSRRYCSFGDVGGRSKGSDFSGLKVLDRFWMYDGGVPEVAAVWHGHLDQDLFAWKSAQISYFYEKALFAMETNSLKKETASSEGEHFLTVLDEISPYYDNLYSRVDPQKIREGAPVIYGFHTNVATKPMIIDHLNGALRDTLYIERDSRAMDECDYYEIKEDGTYGAVEGKHDDHVIITAGSVWLAYHMDLPVLLEEKTETRGKKRMTEATF